MTMGGCIYDPPKKGNEIIIHNQTEGYIFVTDSLPAQGNIRLYDTSLVNKRRQVETKGEYIPRHANGEYFLYEAQYHQLKRKENGTVTLYFIVEKDIGKTYDEIKRDKLYKEFSAGPDDVMNSELNHIFYYNDTIILEHTYGVEKYR